MGDSVIDVEGVDFIYIGVRDFAATRSFYEQVLGLPFAVDYERIPGGEFEAGNLTLQVIQADAIGRQPTSGGHPIALRVPDVAAARAQLEREGVEFIGDDIDSGVCHMAFFNDPDGNTFILHHRYAPRDDA